MVSIYFLISNVSDKRKKTEQTHKLLFKEQGATSDLKADRVMTKHNLSECRLGNVPDTLFHIYNKQVYRCIELKRTAGKGRPTGIAPTIFKSSKGGPEICSLG